MSIGNDGSTICDSCAWQYFPGCAYANGTSDTVFELWPGFHACLACARGRFERDRRLSIREEALRNLWWRARELQDIREQPCSFKVSTLAMAAWEAAEAVRDGAVDHATATAKLLLAAAQAGIEPRTARQTVTAAFAEAVSWAPAA